MSNIKNINWESKTEEEDNEQGVIEVEPIQLTSTPAKPIERLSPVTKEDLIEDEKNQEEDNPKDNVKYIVRDKPKKSISPKIALIASAVISISSITGSLMYVSNATSPTAIIRAGKVSSIKNTGDWVSLPKYGIDAMMPKDMEDITPKHFKDIAHIVQETGWDDEYCALAGIITLPQELKIEYNISTHGNDLWNALQPIMLRCFQEIYDGLDAGSTYNISIEENQELGKHLSVDGLVTLQQYVKNKDTGEIEPHYDTVRLYTTGAIQIINGRPVLTFANYRPAYNFDEADTCKDRFDTISKSVCSVGDVTGQDIQFDIPSIDNVVTSPNGEPTGAPVEVTPPSENLGTVGELEAVTEFERVLNSYGYYKQGDGTWISNPDQIIITEEGVEWDKNGNNIVDDDERDLVINIITEEEAIEYYNNNRENVTEESLKAGDEARKRYLEKQQSAKENEGVETD